MHIRKNLIQTIFAISTAMILLGFQTAKAEDFFTVKGPASHWGIVDITTWEYESHIGGFFEMTVYYDSAVQLGDHLENSYDYQGNLIRVYSSRWWDLVTRIEYTLYDQDWAEIDNHVITAVPYYSPNFETTLFLNDNDNLVDEYYEYWNLETYNVYDGEVNISRKHSSSDLSALLDVVTDMPHPVTIEEWDHSSIYGRNIIGQDMIWFNGTIASLIPGDSDGDSIPNDLDACPESNLSESVSIGSIDTKVDNSLLGNGCTIIDMIETIEYMEDIHGSQVSDVSMFLNDMKSEGIISGRDKGKIQSAIAKSKK